MSRTLPLALLGLLACAGEQPGDCDAPDDDCVAADTDTDTDSDTDSDTDTDTDTDATTGVFSIDVTEVVIDELVPGFARSETFTITNIGGGDLELYDANITEDPSGVFYFERISGVTIGPGQSSRYTVVATLNDTSTAEGELLLLTSDAAAASFTLRLVAVAEAR